jgi:GntR family transcriptional repressor for pyruvate dehydrogenase complex
MADTRGPEGGTPANRREEIYRTLRGHILAGGFPAGGRLPSEPTLCAEYRVSRPLIREVLARLRVEGLVSSRQGAGTFVRADADKDSGRRGFAPVRNLDDMRQCFEFRAAVEGEAAWHAARQRGAADLAELVARADAFAALAGTGDAADLADFAFHEAVAAATALSFFVAVIRSMRQHTMVGMRLAGELSGGDVADRVRRVEAEHRAIVEAVTAGAPEAARAAMRNHIENSRRRLFGATV